MIHDPDCVFCKIVAGEIPAHKIYEDADTFAFLDAHPTAPGHTLVVPKKHVRNIFDIDDNTLATVMKTVRRVAPAVRDGVGGHGVHVNSNHEAAAGQIVFHIHFHIIPRHDRGEFEFTWPKLEESETKEAALARAIRTKLI